MKPYFEDGELIIMHGDCREVLPSIGPFDFCVTDPPYGLGFMGKGWDKGVPGAEFWSVVLSALKPGAMAMAFGGTRTYHRLACAVEDSGFEIRDCLMWLYGTGFPKSLDISKAIDKHGGQSVSWFGPWFRKWREGKGITQKKVAALFPSKTGNLTGCVANWELGFNMPTCEQFNLIRDTFKLPFDSLEEAEREVVGRVERPPGWFTSQDGHDVTAPATDAAKTWNGWGTALKPAWEPIILAMKSLEGTFAENAQRHGAAGLNVDGCRIGTEDKWSPSTRGPSDSIGTFKTKTRMTEQHSQGRWPANVLLDEEAARLLDEQSGERNPGGWPKTRESLGYGSTSKGTVKEKRRESESGGASRFFYTAKASKKERGEGNNHPTVKPIKLLEYLITLVSPPGGGVMVDPFMGSGTGLIAARNAGQAAIGIELEEKYCEIAARRIESVKK